MHPKGVPSQREAWGSHLSFGGLVFLPTNSQERVLGEHFSLRGRRRTNLDLIYRMTSVNARTYMEACAYT